MSYTKRFISLFRARRAAKEAKEAPAQPAPEKARVDIKKFVKIGRPGYKGKISMKLKAISSFPVNVFMPIPENLVISLISIKIHG